MSAFPDWQKFAVAQRQLSSGCIPTGYEMLLRAAGAMDIDFTTFQEDFDFGLAQNHFGNIVTAIKARYPNVGFGFTNFEKGKGTQKLAFIEERLSNKQLVLISLTILPGAWHIMPVVDMDDQNLTMLNVKHADGFCELRIMSKLEFVQIHEDFGGGSEVAYLERC